VHGQVDRLRAFFGKATRILIPFFAFSLGNINLGVIVDTGQLTAGGPSRTWAA